MAKPNSTLAKWTSISSTIATLMFVWSILSQYAPYQLRRYISSRAQQLFDVLSPYIHLSIDEFSGKCLNQNELFTSIQAYLNKNASKDAKRLRLLTPSEKNRVLSMDEFEEVVDRFNGVDVWWTLIKSTNPSSKSSESSRSYRLTFHRKHKKFVSRQYLDHVISEGKKIKEKRREMRLFLNSCRGAYSYDSTWTYVSFNHPATFDSLAMDPEKKREIVEDLLCFKKNKEFYSRIGKAWKRGYLLYGPPGTGKSTLIAAMVNLLEYDVYDLGLTSVTSNTDLRKLLISTKGKSIIVIEDIDCSIDLSGKRDNGKCQEKGSSDSKSADKSKESGVTLSGLLNFIDGIWSSSCGGERIIVFTTNYVDKLDPALIRTGRMDKHIELSYCTFEGFKVLAKNYLLLESHPKFDVIKVLLEETKITPADVAENLMPRFPNDDADTCLDNLIRALVKARIKAAKNKGVKPKREEKKSEGSKKAEEPVEEEKHEVGKKKSEELNVKE